MNRWFLIESYCDAMADGMTKRHYDHDRVRTTWICRNFFPYEKLAIRGAREKRSTFSSSGTTLKLRHVMIINVHFALFIYLIRVVCPAVFFVLSLTRSLFVPLCLFLELLYSAFAWASHRFWVNNIVDCNDKLQLNFCCNEGRPRWSAFVRHIFAITWFSIIVLRTTNGERSNEGKKTACVWLKFDFKLKFSLWWNRKWLERAVKNDELKIKMIQRNPGPWTDFEMCSLSCCFECAIDRRIRSIDHHCIWFMN